MEQSDSGNVSVYVFYYECEYAPGRTAFVALTQQTVEELEEREELNGPRLSLPESEEIWRIVTYLVLFILAYGVLERGCRTWAVGGMSARALYDRWQQALDFAVGEKHTASWEESPLKAAKIVSETFPTIQNEWIYGFLDWVEREVFRGKSLEEPEEDQARMLYRRCICGLEESLPRWKRFVFRYIKMLG